MRIWILFIGLFSLSISAQIGGEEVYTFLNMPTSARQAALGGSTLTLLDEVNQPQWNPAVITPEIDNKLALNYINYLGDINYFSGHYAHMFNRHFGSLYGNLTYLNYGKFIAADEEGVETGTFKAYDMALTIGYAYQVPRTDFYVGANAKVIHSVIEKYNSMGIAGDFGIMYHDVHSPYTFAVAVRNIGTQLVAYDNTLEKLPLRISAGWSYRLEHVPLKVYTTFDNLQQWKLAHSNPSDATTDLEGNVVENEPGFLNNAIRHVVIGAELFPESGFNLRLGYNFQRAQELKIQGVRTFAGLSAGFGLQVRKFKLNYAFNKYHPATDSHTFSLGIDLK